MKRRILSLCITLLSVFLLSTVAFAHSGRTDSDGGHYNRSTGEYHYHHGYPAHQHPGGQCPYVLKQEKQKKSRATIRIVVVVIVSAGIIVAVPVCIHRRRKARAESRRLARELSARLSDLKRQRAALRSQLTSLEIQPISKLVDIPPWSFVGNDGLPHYADPNNPDLEIYEFVLNTSTGVYHIPSCHHARYSVTTNYVDMIRYPYLRSKPLRPCSACRPQKPPLNWYYEYLDYLHALDVLGIDEKQLHYVKAPLKLTSGNTFQYHAGPYRVPLDAVDSELISHIGYDQTHSTLYIRIRKSGRVYTYRNITPMLYDQFIHAESIGRFYNQFIKKHHA